MEDEMRSRAREGNINLSKAQQAVAKHHKDQKAREDASSTTTDTPAPNTMDAE